MQRLVVFDIDGTLTDTNAVDDECYLRAVADTLGLDASTLDWTDAPHITDAALLRWLAERHGCALDPERESAVLDRFVQLLRHRLAATPDRFGAIPGAPGIRSALMHRGWHVALATGGWAPSAHLKLEAIGFDTEDLVVATASDALTRHEIVRLAHQKAIAQHGSFARVVSVGDAPWDVHTAVAAEWPFVGIAAGARAQNLRACGADTIIPDLADVSAVCAALDAATVPRVSNVLHDQSSSPKEACIKPGATCSSLLPEAG
jgi:phosphoglycolate phosphatase-like HAD superfamily hydrolase